MDASIIEVFVQLEELETEVDTILDEIRRVIEKTDLFPEDLRKDAFTRVMHHLNSYETEWDHAQQGFRLPSIFRYIKTLIKRKDPKYLSGYLKSLYEKEKAGGDAEGYLRWKHAFHDKFLAPNDEPKAATLHQGAFDAVDVADDMKMRVVGFVGRWMLKTVANLGERAVKAEMVSLLDEAFQIMTPGWDTFLGTSFAFLGYLGVIGIFNLWCYFRYGRSGARCLKNMIDCGAAFAGQALAGWAAVALCTAIFGPIGAWGLLLGGVVGIPVSILVKKYMSKWTLGWFDLPKDEALEKAYRVLGVSKSAADDEVSRACRRISAENHPDTLARRVPPPSDDEIEVAVDKFIQVQDAYRFVKLAREFEAVKRLDEEDDEGVDGWKEGFVKFMKNLVSFKRRSYFEGRGEEEEFLRTPKGLEFPPLELFLEGDEEVRGDENGLEDDDEVVDGRRVRLVLNRF